MRRIELKNLLPAGTVAEQSSRDLLGELVATSTGAAGDTAAESGGGAGVASAASTLSSILQGPTKDVAEQMSTLASQITSLNSTQQTQTGATQDNTQALTQNTSSKGGPSAASTAGNIASSILGSSWAISPIISGWMSLFGGGSSQSSLSAPPPFHLPPAVQQESGLSGTVPGQAVPISYNSLGQPRPQTVSSSPQITVQVNALDTQSFLDHSDDIARAVKAALLNSNALSDVIADL